MNITGSTELSNILTLLLNVCVWSCTDFGVSIQLVFTEINRNVMVFSNAQVYL